MAGPSGFIAQIGLYIMVKHKIISRYGVTKYCVKSRSGQQLDEMAVQKIRAREVPGLLSVDVDRRKGSFQLIYDVTGLAALSAFLQQPINKNGFIKIIRSIVSIVTAVSDKHLELTKINFEKDSIFINPASHELFCIYIPIGGCDNEITLRDMLQTIVAYCHFSPQENNEYATQFVRFLSERINISKLELIHLLDSMEEKMNVFQDVRKISCPHCGGLVDEGSSFCTNCGKPLTDAARQDRSIYDPFSDMEFQYGSRGMTGGDWMASDSFRQRPVAGQMGGNGTTVLGSVPAMTGGGGATTLLSSQSFPYLIRRRTGERIMIDVSPFRIGQERSQCNYCVPDNSAVSRNHADIYQENGNCYIQDNASTNGTYVNRRRIESYQKTEISHGTQLRLANEDFIFYIEEGDGR